MTIPPLTNDDFLLCDCLTPKDAKGGRGVLSLSGGEFVSNTNLKNGFTRFLPSHILGEELKTKSQKTKKVNASTPAVNVVRLSPAEAELVQQAVVSLQRKQQRYWKLRRFRAQAQASL